MGEGGLMCMYSLIKLQLASEVALSVATSLSSLFNPVFLKTHGKHLKKCKSSDISSKSSNPWSNGQDHQCIVLYVGIHFYSEYDVRLLICKFSSLFRATDCKFPVQGLEIQTSSSTYQAVTIQLWRQQYFTKLGCNQHCIFQLLLWDLQEYGMELISTFLAADSQYVAWSRLLGFICFTNITM